MKDHSIKYRPNKPGSPHLNGKVERVQRTMLEEFYAATDLKSPDLAGALGEWILYYNYQRTHGSLSTTPMKRFCKKIYDAPTWDAVAEQYDPNKERLYVRDYKLDQRLAGLKSDPKTSFSSAASKEAKQGAQDVSRAESEASLDTSEHLATMPRRSPGKR